ncbi:MAG: YihY/virulence factor BrkB family protein, partial [Dehalococcoidia bacterium]
SPLWEIPSVLLPAVLTFVTFALLYRIVPAARPRWRDALPGAFVATLLFEALKNGFAFYVANFNNFDVVYGSLAGVLLFLFFTYLSSAILLIGAELARTFLAYHSGVLRDELYPPQPLPPVTTRAFRAVKGLFVRQ